MAAVQEQVDKSMIFDYAKAVEVADERWLGLVRSKLLAHEYDHPDQMSRDIDKIRRCAEQYHGKRQSRFRNPGKESCCVCGQSTHSMSIAAGLGTWVLPEHAPVYP